MGLRWDLRRNSDYDTDAEYSEMNPINRGIRIASIVVLVGIVMWAVYLWRIGAFTDVEVLRELIHTGKWYAPVLFLLLHLVQIIIPIIPGGVILTAGVVLFGPALGFVYNYTGIIVGTFLAFELARKLGKPFIVSMVGEDTFNKYAHHIEDKNRFTKFFAVAILVPFMPDDALAMMAGLTAMRLRTFLLILLLAKPLSIAAYSGAFSFITQLIP